MNVLFVDFDGVLYGIHNKKEEEKIKILSEIASEYDCKVVFETSYKKYIDKDSLTSEIPWIQDILNLCKKYGIDVIGRTPLIKKKLRKDEYGYLEIWKEDEILLYLKEHPEVEHFCILDDDDRKAMHCYPSDFDLVRDYLVETIYSDKDYSKEGLLSNHKEEVGKILKKENRFKDVLHTPKYDYLDKEKDEDYEW